MSFCPTGLLTRLAQYTGLGFALWLSASSIPVFAADENWQEAAVSPPAIFHEEQLVPLEVSPSSSLRYGIDPSSLSVGTDGVVRYVLVARSNLGALNVLFEGIRCDTGEMKSYARWNNVSAWNESSTAVWRPLRLSGSTRHAMVLAKSGVCDGNTTNGDAANILKSLRTGVSLDR